MNKFYHRDLAAKRWFELSQIEQMANIGSEVFRAIKWRETDQCRSEKAFDRALELFDLTLADRRRRTGWREIARVREFFCSLFFDKPQYSVTADDLNRYFYRFALAARSE